MTDLVAVVGASAGDLTSVCATLDNVKCSASGVVAEGIELCSDVLVGQELARAHVDGHLARGEGLVEHIADAVRGGAGATRAIDDDRGRVGVSAGTRELAVASNTNGETTVSIGQLDVGVQVA